MPFDVNSEEGQELLKALDNKPSMFDDLDQEKKDAVRNYLMDNPEATDPEPEPDPKPDEASDKDDKSKEPDDKSDKDKEKEQEEEDPEKDPKDTVEYWKNRYQEFANDNNTLRQKAKSATERAEKFKKELDEVVKNVKIEDGDDDPYDEKHFKPFVKNTRTDVANLTAKMDFVINKLSERDEHDIKYYGEQAAQTEEQKIFAAVNRLQGEFPDLKTKESFENLNNAWISYADRLVQAAEFGEEYKDKTQSQLHSIALDLHEKNPLFQEKAKNLGIAVPEVLQDKEEFDKYNTILDLHKEGGDLIATYLRRQWDNGNLQSSLEKQKKEAALEASNKTADAIEKKSPTPLTPDDGPGVVEGELTVAKAELILKALNDTAQSRTLTVEEKKQFNEALKVLEKDRGLVKEK